MLGALEPGGALADLTIRDLGDRARAAGRVMAATLHGAKGLEFDVVIVCDVEEGRIPHWGSINSSNPADLEEDRRKFYVALTRARQRVHLVWAAWRISRRGNDMRSSSAVSPRASSSNPTAQVASARPPRRKRAESQVGPWMLRVLE